MKVKVCGFTEPAAMEPVVRLRGTAIGLVLTSSPRQVSPARAAELLDWLPDRVQRWAVFRKPEPELLAAIAGLPFTGVQAEADWDGAGLPAHWAFLPTFADGPALLDQVRGYGFSGTARGVTGLVGAFLVDGPGGAGLGERASVLRCAAAARLGPMVLAGGLTPENVRRAMEEVQPFAVDVSSGVEVVRGVKDAARVEAFLGAVAGVQTGLG